MDKVKVGVIGIGAMGQNHVRIYSELQGVELVGISDKDVIKAREIAGKYNIDSYASYKDLLKKVDAVSISVPTSSHKEVGVEAAKEGVDTLVEKPLAFTIAEADKIIAAAKASKSILMVGHVERFNPAVRELKKIFGKLNPIQIEARRCSPPVERAGIVNVDAVFDLMIHDIDVVRYLTGSEPKTIFAMGGKSESGVENYATALTKFKNGTLVLLSANRITQKKIRELMVTTPDRFIHLDYMEQSLDIYRKSFPAYAIEEGEVVYKQENVIEKVGVYKEEPLKIELRHFIDCVKRRKEPEIDGVEGKKNLEIAIEILKRLKQ